MILLFYSTRRNTREDGKRYYMVISKSLAEKVTAALWEHAGAVSGDTVETVALYGDSIPGLMRYEPETIKSIVVVGDRCSVPASVVTMFANEHHINCVFMSEEIPVYEYRIDFPGSQSMVIYVPDDYEPHEH